MYESYNCLFYDVRIEAEKKIRIHKNRRKHDDYKRERVFFFFIIKIQIQNSNRRLLEAFNAIIMNAFERGLSTKYRSENERQSANWTWSSSYVTVSRFSRKDIFVKPEHNIVVITNKRQSRLKIIISRSTYHYTHTPTHYDQTPSLSPRAHNTPAPLVPKRPLWNSRETSEDIHYNTGMMVIVVMIHLVATLRDSIGPRQQKHNRLCPRRERGWHKRTRLM